MPTPVPRAHPNDNQRAAETRSLRDPRGDRQGSDGGRLPGARPAHRPPGRAEDLSRRLFRQGSGARPVPQPLRARGAERGDPLPPQHRDDPRCRGRGRRGDLLHRDGVREGHEPQAADAAAGDIQLRTPRRHPVPDRGGPRLRALPRRGPPRHQAGEHPHRAGRQGQDHRFRHRPARHLEPDDGRPAPGHSELHGTGADPGQGGRPPRRHLLARRRLLRDADAEEAVPGREPHGGDAQDRLRAIQARRRDHQRPAARAHCDHDALPGERPEPALSEGGRDRRRAAAQRYPARRGARRHRRRHLGHPGGSGRDDRELGRATFRGRARSRYPAAGRPLRRDGGGGGTVLRRHSRPPPMAPMVLRLPWPRRRRCPGRPCRRRSSLPCLPSLRPLRPLRSLRRLPPPAVRLCRREPRPAPALPWLLVYRWPVALRAQGASPRSRGPLRRVRLPVRLKPRKGCDGCVPSAGSSTCCWGWRASRW